MGTCRVDLPAVAVDVDVPPILSVTVLPSGALAAAPASST